MIPSDPSFDPPWLYYDNMWTPISAVWLHVGLPDQTYLD